MTAWRTEWEQTGRLNTGAILAEGMVGNRSRSRDRMRERFFDRGAEAWKRIINDLRGPNADKARAIREDVYACPLCNRVFTRGALKARDLTLEHVPPKALGGREIILTCKECNSTAGTRLDAEVKQRDDLIALGRAMFQKSGPASADARVQFRDLSLNTELQVDGSGLTLTISESRNDPRSIAAAVRMKPAGSEEVRITITPKIRFHEFRSKVGDLRTAYLAAFAAYGYRWGWDVGLATIRQQIQEPEKEIVKNAWFLNSDRSLPVPQLVRLTVPVYSLAVFVSHGIVILPLPGSPVNLYDQIGDAITGDNRSIVLQGEGQGWPTGPNLQADFM